MFVLNTALYKIRVRYISKLYKCTIKILLSSLCNNHVYMAQIFYYFIKLLENITMVFLHSSINYLLIWYNKMIFICTLIRHFLN